MSGELHALLIGIDAYDGDGSLHGCVNDIDAIQRALVDRLAVPRERITRLASPRHGDAHQTDVPEQPANLQQIRAAFDHLAGDAVARDDRVFIYYSGHGTRAVLRNASGKRYTREALLPKDKISGPIRRFFYDWQLNEAIARISGRCSSVTVILDCCCSSGATRGEQDVADRYWPTRSEESVEESESTLSTARGITQGLLGLVDRCQVIAACRSDEKAREMSDEQGRTQGNLTRALCRQLALIADGALADLRWGHIWRAIEADVQMANRYQHPWISGSFARRVFGGDPDAAGDVGFGIVEANGIYRVDAGTLAGVTEGAEIAVYGPEPPEFPALQSAQDEAARLGILQVTKADPASAEAVSKGPLSLVNGARGRLSKSGVAAKLRVALNPHDADWAAELAKSPLLELADGADLTLVRTSEGWALTDDIHGVEQGDPFLAIIPLAMKAAARRVVEHYYHYSAPLRMAKACRDLPSMLRLRILDCSSAELSGENAQSPNLPEVAPGSRAPYELANGGKVCFVVENEAPYELSVSLFDLAHSGKVLLLGEERMARNSQHAFWANNTLGQPFEMRISPGRDVVDRIVALATTRDDVSLRHMVRNKSFEEALEVTRGARTDAAATAEMWTSAVTALRVSNSPS